MKFRRRLRSRLIVSFGLFGALLSVLFAFAVLLMQSWLEDALIARTLADEVNEYVQDLRVDPTLVEPFYTRIQGYVTRPERADIVPTPFRDLPSGVHDVRTADGVFKAAIAKEDDFWVFLTYDISDNRELSRRLVLALIVAVVFFSLLSLALGVWSAGRVMAPVTALAKRLETLDENAEPGALKQFFTDDEVGQLASTLDDYAHRLQELVERDKAFNADVSHELRTPLAVISGATELMLAQPDLSERNRDRLQRIARAAQQSADITTALLHLVRSEKGGSGTWPAQDVGRIAVQVLDNYRPLVSERDLKLELETLEPLSVIAPDSVIAVILGNLIGNAVRYTAKGEVRVRVERGRVVILDTGPGIPEDELPNVFDRHFRGRQSGGSKGSGLGLSIVKRLCDLYGWEIDFANRPEGGLEVSVRFFPDLEAD
ncbi:sensor histidine kinase [Wenzhouxiangella marina]|uniref:histidine kinase n=1 Tax=Wenzhouxiangella marina TaxID=1579979 RepID=A0A0K0XZL8_9GAMM|nr:HAMP domain-containing sensor histidine kinase [Wenzhouxiangella marina]AKS43066.1 histidine kinase [Wenzhouxiangella marina]MBB6087250.1 signal transduction histidine kinase [Wenzhouxiangella marina]